MNKTIKTSELKTLIKSIVRENLNRQVQEADKSMHEYEPEKDDGSFPQKPGDLEKSKGNFNPDYTKKFKKKEKSKADEAGLTSEEGETSDNSSLTPKECQFLYGVLREYESTRKLQGGAKAALSTIMSKVSAMGGNLAEASYKQVSPNETDTAAEDKARTIQTDPKVNEAFYKVVSPNAIDTAKENKALTIQTEPKVNEQHELDPGTIVQAMNTILSKGGFDRIPRVSSDSKEELLYWVSYATENDAQTGSKMLKKWFTSKQSKPLHGGAVSVAYRLERLVQETAYKTQGPSLKTFDDSPQFPKAVNNPKNA